MLNVTATLSFVFTLEHVQQSIARYGYALIFVLGNIGSFLNVLVLTRRSYFRSSCSYYILASTVPNLLIINVVILTRILATFDLDFTRRSVGFCKFQWYIAHSMTLLSRGYILFACIDRWAMTSRTMPWRALAQVKVAMLIIPILALMWVTTSVHVIRYQNIVLRKASSC